MSFHDPLNEILAELDSAARGHEWGIENADKAIGKLGQYVPLAHQIAILIASKPFANKMRYRPALAARFVVEFCQVGELPRVLNILEAVL